MGSAHLQRQLNYSKNKLSLSNSPIRSFTWIFWMQMNWQLWKYIMYDRLWSSIWNPLCNIWNFDISFQLYFSLSRIADDVFCHSFAGLVAQESYTWNIFNWKTWIITILMLSSSKQGFEEETFSSLVDDKWLKELFWISFDKLLAVRHMLADKGKSLPTDNLWFFNGMQPYWTNETPNNEM